MKQKVNIYDAFTKTYHIEEVEVEEAKIVEEIVQEPTSEERLTMLESAMQDLILMTLGGAE